MLLDKIFTPAKLTLAITIAGIAPARAGLTDFNDMTTDVSVNGQGSWTVVDQFGANGEEFDEEVVNIGPGQNVWRMSNAQTNSTYSNQPYSSSSAQVAGETGATLYNDLSPKPGPDGPATTPYFHASWDFTSATGAAQGTSGNPLQIAVSPTSRYSTNRMSYINMVDDGSPGGFSLGFYEATSAGFPFVEIATNLAYDEWHTVDIFIEFVDGVNDIDGVLVGNDIVSILLDGTLIHTGTTWEGYYGSANLNAVDTLLYRANAGTGVLVGNADTLGEGFYFDNVYTGNEAVPEPSTYALLIATLAGLVAWKRRRS